MNYAILSLALILLATAGAAGYYRTRAIRAEGTQDAVREASAAAEERARELEMALGALKEHQDEEHKKDMELVREAGGDAVTAAALLARLHQDR